jgi:hypothetical protein
MELGHFVEMNDHIQRLQHERAQLVSRRHIRGITLGALLDRIVDRE